MASWSRLGPLPGAKKGQTKSKRKILLTLECILAALAAAAVVVVIVEIVGIVPAVMSGREDAIYMEVMSMVLWIMLIGLGASDCRIQGRCGSYLVVDHDGSVYPCEYYTTEDWCMGNIRQDLSLLFNSDAFRLFIQMAHDLPDDCMSCPYALLCRGGCPRERAYSETRVDNSLCEGLRAFFDTAMPALEELAQLRAQGGGWGWGGEGMSMAPVSGKEGSFV